MQQPVQRDVEEEETRAVELAIKESLESQAETEVRVRVCMHRCTTRDTCYRCSRSQCAWEGGILRCMYVAMEVAQGQ